MIYARNSCDLAIPDIAGECKEEGCVGDGDLGVNTDLGNGVDSTGCDGGIGLEGGGSGSIIFSYAENEMFLLI